MDSLAKRYASPFFVTDQYIALGRFSDFIDEFWEMHNEEEIFNIWLHKVEGKSYEEFRQSIIKPQRRDMDENDLAATLRESLDIVNGFNLESMEVN